MDKDFLLNKSKVFCMRPWVHLHINTSGNILPCCISENTFGNIREQPIEDIWQETEIKSFRLKMISEKKIKSCADCYRREESGFKSLRQFSNEVFENKFPWVEATQKDGSSPLAKPVFWDIRFSNICNFRCRTCSHYSSSKWFEDAKSLGEQIGNSAIIAAGDSTKILTQLEQYADEVEEVYFGGGEPLIMEENFSILKLLISKNRINVRLWYNTNFSNFKYKDYNIIDLWNQFKQVTVSASLDDSYERAEYLRKEQKWQDIIRNRELLLSLAPHVQFKIQTTVSVYNAYHFTDFHREWIEEGYIEPENLEINILHHPEFYNIQLLPTEFKNKIKEKIKKHILYVKKLEEVNKSTYSFLISNYESVINYLFSSGKEMYQMKFIEKTKKLDSLRKENFLNIFPEFSEVFNFGITFE